MRFVVQGDSPISGTYTEFDKNNRFSGKTSSDGFKTAIPRNMEFDTIVTFFKNYYCKDADAETLDFYINK